MDSLQLSSKHENEKAFSFGYLLVITIEVKIFIYKYLQMAETLFVKSRLNTDQVFVLNKLISWESSVQFLI